MNTTISNGCAPSQSTGLERTRFYAGQLVAPTDLTQDQVYFREKLRRHNRLLHGWGIVCGARVRWTRGETEVVVEPGYILGPYGDEIVINERTRVDLCRTSTDSGCGEEELDPWCTDTAREEEGGLRYLAIRYAECRTRPVRSVGGCGCGCNESQCEHSRIRDSFEIRVLPELPSTYTSPLRPPAPASAWSCSRGGPRACPSCPAEPWVILADLQLGGRCTIESVDCYKHRRYVASFASFFYTCSPRQTDVPPVIKNPDEYTPPLQLLDASAEANTMPRASVMVERTDGTQLSLPAYFTVQSGDTLRTVVEREGDRQLVDADTGRTYTLRELYTRAGVSLDQPVSGTAAALQPLEGLMLDD